MSGKISAVIVIVTMHDSLMDALTVPVECEAQFETLVHDWIVLTQLYTQPYLIFDTSGQKLERVPKLIGHFPGLTCEALWRV